MGIVVDALLGAGNAHLAQKLQRLRTRGARINAEMHADGLDELSADRVKRIEGSERILKNRADLPAADLSHLLRRQIVDAAAVEADLAAGDAAGRLQQADDRRA